MINQSWTGIPKQKTRRSIRLQTYDYASTGMYFFTICTHNRAPLFGCVTDAQMQLNDFGNVFGTNGIILPQFAWKLRLTLSL